MSILCKLILRIYYITYIEKQLNNLRQNKKINSFDIIYLKMLFLISNLLFEIQTYPRNISSNISKLKR